ncbi:hypothetical protein QJS04_geneDACA022379 [Acorus gramineus]|uniref:Uncharacterized protein n=1 Tax=Acorus gramineus TaxID=55184 RepID=A0AAV9B5J9_ACOGR|nr:hypothetical protein QJS04_geneDACA022379 [Acorus gramineus]
MEDHLGVVFPSLNNRLSKVWAGILDGMADFSEVIRWELGSRDRIRFWEDVWLGETSLRERFPGIFQMLSAPVGNTRQF